jgi:hypothetical protein
MPPKKKPARPTKAKASANAKASNRTSVVVNVNAPTRRKAASKGPSKKAGAAGASLNVRPQSIYFHAPPTFHTLQPNALAQQAVLEGIQRDVASLKQSATTPRTPVVSAAVNPMYDAMSLSSLPQTPATTRPVDAAQQAEGAFERSLPSPYMGQRLSRRETMYDPAGGPLVSPRPSRPAAGTEGTVRNPLSGAAITIGGKKHRELVRQGVLPPSP